QNAGRYEAQHRLLAADDERVTRVVPALEPHDAIGVLGEPVDDLAFAFIAPLGADDDDVLAHSGGPRFARDDARKLSQVQRETGGGTRASERLADAVVAAAATDRVRLPFGEHREDRAAVVMIAGE